MIACSVVGTVAAVTVVSGAAFAAASVLPFCLGGAHSC